MWGGWGVRDACTAPTAAVATAGLRGGGMTAALVAAGIALVLLLALLFLSPAPDSKTARDVAVVGGDAHGGIPA